MELLPNEVHLWCAYDEGISASELLSIYHDLLSDDERKQQKRFRFQRNRHQYLVTRALVRSVLAQYIPGIRPNEIKFSKNKYGKPYLDSTPIPFPLKFNISHSEKLITLVVTKGITVGVDVEYRRRNSNVVPIADRFFSPNEIKSIKSLDQNKQHERFFDLWTLKEAYIKAKSKGLSIPLDKFSFDLKFNDKIEISFDNEHIVDDSSKWQFWQLEPSNTHTISIAIASDNIDKHSFSLVIREAIPLVATTLVDYPIIRTG